MNKIKGILIKDLAQLRGYKRSLVAITILFILALLPDTQEHSLDVTSQSMLLMIFGITGITTFNFDESTKTDRFLLTMPLTKKELVKEKYILSIAGTIIGAFVTCLLSIIMPLLIQHTLPSFLSIIVGITGSFCFVSILISFQIPCIYRWGAEKGRIQAMVIMSISIGILAGVSILFGNNIVSKIDLNRQINTLYYVLPFVFIGLSIIAYFISYLISIRQFQKREI